MTRARPTLRRLWPAGRVAGWAGALLAGPLLLAGCPAPAAPESDPAGRYDRLLEAAAAEDGPAVETGLEGWPVDAAAFRDDPFTQRVLTWRLGRRAEAGDGAGALADLARLEERFDGFGRSRRGQVLAPAVVRGALRDALLEAARRAGEGPEPRRERALALIEQAAAAGGADPAEEDEAEGLRAWIGAQRGEDLAPRLGAAPGPGPRVQVYADHFTLGEPVFAGVLERWARTGAEAGVGVALVGLRTGQVRLGLRRVPVASPAEEAQALAARAQELGLVAEPPLDAERFATALGLPSGVAALVLLDARGRIVARAAGVNLDPREVEVAFQRLVSR